MAVGLPLKTTYADGDVFSASDINDTNGTINAYVTTGPAAGVNKIINGDMGIWQRGTSFTPNDGSWSADRWKNFFNGTGSTRTYSQQTFTLGTAPVAGYEATFFLRLNQSVAGTGGTYNQLAQPIENVRTFAGQTVTMSFWAKAAATTVLPNLFLGQNFGVGGSADVDTTVATNVSITTSWTRYTYTVTLPSIAGKTIGTGSYLNYRIHLPLNSTFTLDFWGMQLEAGSTATTFQTASGTIGGELLLAQRYYYRVNTEAGTGGLIAGFGSCDGSTIADLIFPFPSTFRIAPTSLEQAQARVYNLANGTNYSGGSWTLGGSNNSFATARYTHGSGVFTSGSGVKATSSGSGSAYLAFSAEL